MGYYLNQRVRDINTGDYGRIFVVKEDGSAIAVTRGGRAFTEMQATSGPKQPIVDRFFALQEMKACNCAGCKKELLSREHEVEVENARRRGEDITGLPPFVAGYLKRKDGHRRPFCEFCFEPLI